MMADTETQRRSEDAHSGDSDTHTDGSSIGTGTVRAQVNTPAKDDNSLKISNGESRVSGSAR